MPVIRLLNGSYEGLMSRLQKSGFPKSNERGANEALASVVQGGG